MDETELRTEIARLHKLISGAAERAKQEKASAILIDKLTSAELRIELLMKKLRPKP